ncbi:unnamed protein product [Ceutorhynchus assimilis]|uniref:Spindle assembly abnormal protein 6 N-terminal domain-containing protein n=1 Tax=Ceutorhynchus assimilis TaxID=467358 RepID=A0A9N9QSQ1_9CUCU|nr:unnamed protein product [Ceutorhynchus assimilis]
MPYKEHFLYNDKIIIPIVQRNDHTEDRHLNISILEVADKLQIKIRDLTDYSFNYSDTVGLADFELIRCAQSLDINFSEFKANIIDMLHQYQKKEMYLKCQISDNKCTLVFYMKSKIKNMVYLTLDLQKTNETEIIAEIHAEKQEAQELIRKLEKQLGKTKKLVEEKDFEIQDIEKARKLMLEQFCKNLRYIESWSTSKLVQIQNQVLTKITALSKKINILQTNIEILKQENNLKAVSSDRLMKTMENLRVENMESNRLNEKLKKENGALNILRCSLERNVADMKKTVDELQSVNRNMERKQIELEKDLGKLSIIVTQKESKINELSKDVVQANNMLVQFNSCFDEKAQQLNELQKSIVSRDRIINEQKLQNNQVLIAFEEYKREFSAERFGALEKDLLMSRRKIDELEEEMRKINKINALLTHKIGQGCFGMNMK